MSKIYDGQPDYQQGGDSGQDTASSIQPINNAENLYAANLNRAVENVRVRTEEIRQQLLDLHYYSDYDRGFILKSDALFSFIESDPVGDPGRYELVMTADDLVILPALTPGYTSGGRDRGAKMFTQQGGNWVPYAGTLGADDLTFITSAQFTGMRGYNDANDFNVDLNGFSLGGNRLTLTLIADPAINGGIATMTATVTGSPAVDITITYGTLTPTTVTDIISFVNTDAASQGGYGLSAILRASTTSPGVAAPPTITSAVFQGGYDAEGHKITPAMLSAFFAATDGLGNKINRLRDGESLAIAYTYGPVESGVAGANGGRRQSLYDLPANRLGAFTDNTAPAVGWNLYNTGREPEKIPGSVPVGKRVKNVFVLLDGTIVTTTPGRLGESSALLARLASTVFPTGASLIGYGGSGPWEDTTIVAPGTLEAALDSIVASLASKTALADGAGKLGISAQTGLPTSGNLPLNLGASSIRTAIAALLNTAPTSTTSGGVNSRVSENGHTLKTYAPITKDLSALATAGGQRFAAQLTSTGNQNFLVPVRGGREEFADIVVQPMAVSGVILAAEPISFGTFPGSVRLTDATIAARFVNMNALLPSMQTYSESAPGSKALSACIMVLIQGTTGGVDGNGYYLFSKLSFLAPPARDVYLLKLDGTVPDFATTNFVGATLTFLNTHIRGSNSSSNFERSYHVAENFAEKVVALPGTLNPWLETYYSDVASIGNDAIKGSYHLAAKSVWQPTAPTPRDSDNILGTADKALLDGVETGIPTDASLSHHHNGFYSLAYASNLEAARPFITIGIAAAIDLATLASPLGDYIQLPTHNVPAGYRPTGVTLMYKLQILTSAAAAALVSASINLRASPAVLATGGYNAAPSRLVTTAQFLKQNAAMVADGREFYGDITCACNMAGQVAFKILNTTNIDDLNSYLQVFPQYYSLIPTTLVSLLQQGGAASFIGAVVSGEVTVTGLTGMTVASVGRFLEISGSTTSIENNGVFLISAFVSAGTVKIRAPYATVPDPGPLSWSERI